MDKTTLVSLDLERALEVVRALENGDLKLSVALWMYTTEYEEWRLFVSARQFDELDPIAAYRFLNDLLDAAGLPFEKTPPVVILCMADPFVKGLRQRFGKTKNIEGTRLGSQTIGNRYVEDAFVYRIS